MLLAYNRRSLQRNVFGAEVVCPRNDRTKIIDSIFVPWLPGWVQDSFRLASLLELI